MNDTAALRILLLGSPVVTAGPDPVRIDGRLQRCLLYYLACRGQAVQREELLVLFWPDKNESESRKKLREVLSRLKSDLDPYDVLEIERDTVALKWERVYIDVLDFRSLVRQTSRGVYAPNHQPLPEGIYEQILRAMHLWRGQTFMTGVYLDSIEYEDWLQLERNEMEAIYHSLMERLARHSLASGDLDAAYRWLHQGLENDEYNLDLQGLLLVVLKEMGKRTEALKYCLYLEELYGSSVDGALPPDLYLQIQELRRESGTPPRARRTPLPVSINLQVPFIGREVILQNLRQCFFRGGTAVIYGEAGSGKSRLLHELFQTLEPAPRLLWASARAMETILPFQPLIETLRQSVLAEEWRGLDSVWAAILAQLMPEIAIQRPGLPTQSRPSLGESRSQLFEAFHQLLLYLARTQRVVVFLDDVQWCDQQTLEVLTYLVQRSFFAEKGLLVIASRVEERSPYLETFLANFRASAGVQQLELTRFDEQEIADLTRLTLGVIPPKEFLERLGRETGGNPLFILETLRAILDVYGMSESGFTAERLPLASSIHALVRERTRQLNPAVQQILVTAALMGGRFQPGVVGAAAQQNPDTVVKAVEELNRLRLVEPDGGADGEYRFVHDKIREVLTLELSPVRKRLIHQRIAQALETTPATAPGVLAYHHEAAGNIPQAIENWVRAAEYARRVFAYPEATRAFQRAEQLLPRLENVQLPGMAYRLFAAWGDLANAVMDMDAIQYSSSRLIQLGEQLNDPLLTGSGLVGQAKAVYLRGQVLQALRMVEEAIHSLDQAGNLHEQIEAYNASGIFLLVLNRYPQAQASLLKSLNLGEGSHDPLLVHAKINAEINLALVNLLMGWPVKAVELAQTALRQSQQEADYYLLIQAYPFLASAQYYSGQFAQALQTCTAGLQLAERFKNEWYLSMLHNAAARAATGMGRLDEAWQHAHTALEICERNRFADMLAEAHCILADIYRLLQDYPTAIEEYNLGSDGGSTTVHSADNLYRLGYVLALSGQVSAGRAMIEQALAYAQTMQVGMIEVPARSALAFVELIAGQWKAALAAAEKASEQAVQRGMHNYKNTYRRVQASIALQQGSPGETVEEARLLIHDAGESSNPWLELMGQQLLWQALTQSGQADAAAAPAARISELLDEMRQFAQSEPIQARFENFRKTTLEKLVQIPKNP